MLRENAPNVDSLDGSGSPEKRKSTLAELLARKDDASIIIYLNENSAALNVSAIGSIFEYVSILPERKDIAMALATSLDFRQYPNFAMELPQLFPGKKHVDLMRVLLRVQDFKAIHASIEHEESDYAKRNYLTVLLSNFDSENAEDGARFKEIFLYALEQVCTAEIGRAAVLMRSIFLDVCSGYFSDRLNLQDIAFESSLLRRIGVFPLHVLVEEKQTEVLQELLSLSIFNAGVRDGEGRTPLGIACGLQDIELVRALLIANPAVLDNACLQQALDSGNIHLMTLLVSKLKSLEEHPLKQAYLEIACAQKKLPLMCVLVSKISSFPKKIPGQQGESLENQYRACITDETVALKRAFVNFDKRKTERVAACIPIKNKHLATAKTTNADYDVLLPKYRGKARNAPNDIKQHSGVLAKKTPALVASAQAATTISEDAFEILQAQQDQITESTAAKADLVAAIQYALPAELQNTVDENTIKKAISVPGGVKALDGRIKEAIIAGIEEMSFKELSHPGRRQLVETAIYMQDTVIYTLLMEGDVFKDFAENIYIPPADMLNVNLETLGDFEKLSACFNFYIAQGRAAAEEAAKAEKLAEETAGTAEEAAKAAKVTVEAAVGAAVYIYSFLDAKQLVYLEKLLDLTASKIGHPAIMLNNLLEFFEENRTDDLKDLINDIKEILKARKSSNNPVPPQSSPQKAKGFLKNPKAPLLLPRGSLEEKLGRLMNGGGSPAASAALAAEVLAPTTGSANPGEPVAGDGTLTDTKRNTLVFSDATSVAAASVNDLRPPLPSSRPLQHWSAASATSNDEGPAREKPT